MIRLFRGGERDLVPELIIAVGFAFWMTGPLLFRSFPVSGFHVGMTLVALACLPSFLSRLPMITRPGIWAAFGLLAATPVAAAVAVSGQTMAWSFYLVVLPLGAIIASSHWEREPMLRQLAIVLAIVAVPLAILTVTGIGTTVSSSGRLGISGAGPLPTARALGWGAIALAHIATRAEHWLTRNFAYGALGICLVATALTGSRGPLVAAVVGSAILAAAYGVKRLVPTLLVGMGVLGIAAWFGESRVSNRLITLADPAGALEESGRAGIWSESLRHIPGRPTGIGFGRFAEEIQLVGGSGDIIPHPHNWIIEAFLAGGVVFGLWLVGYAIAVFRRAWKGRHSSEGRFTLALLAAGAINAGLTSDLVGNSILLGLLAVASRRGQAGLPPHAAVPVTKGAHAASAVSGDSQRPTLA